MVQRTQRLEAAFEAAKKVAKKVAVDVGMAGGGHQRSLRIIQMPKAIQAFGDNTQAACPAEGTPFLLLIASSLEAMGLYTDCFCISEHQN